MKIEDVFRDLPPLDTPRLRLRKVSLEDAEDLFACTSDEEVARFKKTPIHQTVEETEGLLEMILGLYRQHQAAPWGIEHRADGHLIGTCGFVECFPAHRRAEIAFALARTYRRQGLMSEAVRRVIRFGFEEMSLNRIQARCLVTNDPSMHVLERAGMHLEGIMRQHVLVGGRFQDLRLYSILADEGGACRGSPGEADPG